MSTPNEQSHNIEINHNTSDLEEEDTAAIEQELFVEKQRPTSDPVNAYF